MSQTELNPTGTATARPELGETQTQEHYLNCSSGFKSWAFTLDHKRIGVMYLVGVCFAFLLGGLFAMGVRTELIAPGYTIMDADTYNQMFSLHGAVMVFLFLIPSIPASLGNFVLPIMLGAKDVAFPRLNLFSFHLWVTGAIFFVLVLLTNGLDTGWTFYTPYSTTTDTSVVFATLGAFILGFSSIFTGLNFIATIHMMRPPGMGWFKMPLFLWGMYSTSVIQILATPVLGITLLLLIVERTLGFGIFDPALGGDPVLFQHFFWFYSHPAVYIMILPAMAVMSELFSTFSHKHVFGYRFIAMSSLAIALLGFLVWGHHMFTSGQSKLAGMVFSAITFTIAIPSAIKVFNWLTTMYKGSISLRTPMWYALSFIFLFGIGGLTGLFLGTMSTDVHLHDTYFIVAHFHFVMVGGTLIAFLGGLHYWWPKMFGKMYNEKLGVIGAWGTFLGFNLTFLPQFVLGTRGMPRRYYDYEDRSDYISLHFWSTMGSYLLAASLGLILVYLIQSLIKGKKAPANPWGSATLEWETTSPPVHHNFDDVPTVRSDPYDYEGLVKNQETGNYERVEARAQ